MSGLDQTLRTAAADRSTKPGVLGPSLDGTVAQVAQAVGKADATLREPVRSGRI